MVAARPTLWESGRMMFSVHVEVRLRPGIADPAGATIERSLPHLGFEGISGVQVGKSIRFSLEAADEASARVEVEDMCRRFLTNPVIEDAVVAVEALEGSPA
ncbi:MAG: phosphoribosylformylglycinamidine synthase subunit PurS [Acidimicrobiales bacterium]|jgi:phosphoribosylformylglycinamidine synthase|nr:phosphoribosylformylglycinamidine synthase subunit PurS [Acidimicrobiales bacterium]